MKRFLLLSLTVLLFLGLSGCKEIQPLDASQVKSVRLVNLTKEGIELEVTMRVKNPNDVKFKIKKSNLDVSLNNTRLGKATIKDKIVIKKMSDEDHIFIIKSKFTQLAAGGLTAVGTVLTGGRADIKLNGDVKVKAFGVSKKVPISIQHPISLRNR